MIQILLHYRLQKLESIDDFIAKSQKQGAKVVVNKKEISESFYAILQVQQQNTFGLWQSK